MLSPHPTHSQGHCLFSCLGQGVGLLPMPRSYGPEGEELGTPLSSSHSPQPPTCSTNHLLL